MPCLRWGAIATLAQGSGAMLRKTVQVLMIIGLGTVGSAAAGAGVGGAIGGAKGALIGAAVGGGAASIYEAVKRR
jgi:hypothetical protein